MFILRLKESWEAGLERIRWVAEILSERFKVEAAVIKLLKESDNMQRERDALLSEIGERVFEVKDRSALNTLEDTKIRLALGKLEKIDTELEELKRRASEISTVV